jgi:hypothetical protein
MPASTRGGGVWSTNHHELDEAAHVHVRAVTEGLAFGVGEHQLGVLVEQLYLHSSHLRQKRRRGRAHRHREHAGWPLKQPYERALSARPRNVVELTQVVLQAVAGVGVHADVPTGIVSTLGGRSSSPWSGL